MTRRRAPEAAPVPRAGAHFETYATTTSASVIKIACTCALGADHTYAVWVAARRPADVGELALRD